MTNIKEKIEIFLKKYGLNNSKKTFLVAFSGGFDSMCLLDILKKNISNRIIAIHLNHNWRGKESDLEEENCRNFCSLNCIEFYSEKLSMDIAHTETAARKARYEFFRRCTEKFNTDTVFTAHNKNDNAETLIYRICKGTGISGLQGISENRGIYYRPLLAIKRTDIEKYCKDNGLSPNCDSSNTDTKYNRNYIRHEVVPALAKVNEHIIDSLNSLSAVAQEETEIVEEYVNLILKNITEKNQIKTKEFLQLSEPVQKRIIYNIFIQNDIDYDRQKILNIWNFIRGNSGSKAGKTCSLTTNLWIFTSQKYIEVISASNNQLPYFQITKEGIYESNGYIFEIEKFSQHVDKFPQDSENKAYVCLSDFPFEVRGRQNGDIIQPLGGQGVQKLKKYLNSKKIPNHKKSRLLFMAQGKEILWAIGLGLGDKIKVTGNPTHRLKFYKKS